MKEAIRCDIACVKPFLPMLISTVVVIDIVWLFAGNSFSLVGASVAMMTMLMSFSLSCLSRLRDTMISLDGHASVRRCPSLVEALSLVDMRWCWDLGSAQLRCAFLWRLQLTLSLPMLLYLSRLQRFSMQALYLSRQRFYFVRLLCRWLRCLERRAVCVSSRVASAPLLR